MTCVPHKNPLERGGTSQTGRRLPGLSPDYVRVDERRDSDWIVFAAEYSRFLAFYDARDGALQRGWEAFFARDLSAVLGRFAIQDIESWRLEVRQHLNFLRDDDNAGDETGLRQRFSELISAAFTLAAAVDAFYLELPESVAFKTALQREIKGKLAGAFRRLVGHYQGSVALGLYQTLDSPTNWTILGRPLTDAASLLAGPSSLSAAWWDPDNGVNQPTDIPADASIFGQAATVFGRLSHAANHSLFSSQFDQFTESYARLIGEAETALSASLDAMDSHKPHYALFLAFVRLFRQAQDRLNTVTWRHLEHYYEDILRLRPKAPEPDHVHLVAELARSVDSLALPAGTLFRAGKDSQGKEVSYALERETTFNKAAVAEHRSIYRVDPAERWEDGGLGASKRYFAAPVADSADGAGAPLVTPLKEWHPFLNRTVAADGRTSSVNMPPARIGFALASHQLFLAEGARKIKLRFAAAPSFKSLPAAKLTCLLSAEKGWLEKAPLSVSETTFSDKNEACTEVLIQLSGTDPAVVAWSAKIHGGAFGVDVPVVQCVLDPSSAPYGLDELKNVIITRVEVQVQVGASSAYDDTGAKQLVLANANGSIDPSKPFLPWGAVPVKDAPLYVGSKELFSKANAKFNLHIEWANLPSTVSPSPSARLDFLEGGAWKAESPSSTPGPICDHARQKVFNDDVVVPTAARIDHRDPLPGLTPASKAGFFRLRLDGDFGHEVYAATQLKGLITRSGGSKEAEDTSFAVLFNEVAYSVAQSSGSQGVQSDAPLAIYNAVTEAIKGKKFTTPVLGKPYTPTIAAIYLSYTAASGAVDLTVATDEAFTARTVRFFHLGPFGEAEQDFPLPGATGHSLLPQFRFGGNPDHVGEWLIGIKNLAAQQAVTLLFQLLEGSTVPTLSKPEKHVTWSYWAGGRWVVFEDNEVEDGTRQLTQSGLIRFTIPAMATTDKGIVPRGLIWLMASVEEAVGAVCKVISVRAQGMLATFADQGNAADRLEQPLPPGTISKLKVPDARVKKIEQLFPSFGGRPAESRDRFHLRSSERLRHKGRAVTIWDYEALVLEAFPSLYKVKCLNHTRVEDKVGPGQGVYDENQPGHVTVIAIPSLTRRTDADPLRPYVAQDQLSAIRDFLRARVTGQLVRDTVNVHVCNPLFEEIRIEFDLHLKDGYDDFNWYRQQLQEEITRFLSPWAFGGEAEVRFGGRIAKSVLINFIEERPYVDFITNVVLKHRPGEGGFSGDLEEAVATTARSVLVSAPAAGHLINEHT